MQSIPGQFHAGHMRRTSDLLWLDRARDERLGRVGKLNIDRYSKDLDALLRKGAYLQNAIQFECSPRQVEEVVRKKLGDKATEFIDKLPSFKAEYQKWYSEAKVLVRQLLPDRLDDFTRYYEKPKGRKNVTFENYVIEDYLQGLQVTKGLDTVVSPDAAVPRFHQQLSIVESIRDRFQSSLFDIHQLAQADLFDSELDAAKELARNKFYRAAGAVAGVVLERHLKEICNQHSVTIRKRKPQISDLNDALKDAVVLDTPQWRSVQHLGDLRNQCVHDGEAEPTKDQVEDLLAGVAKVTKTIF